MLTKTTLQYRQMYQTALPLGVGHFVGGVD